MEKFHNRNVWLSADTKQVVNASATCYSLIETARANSLEPSAYIHPILKHIGEAETFKKLEALLPWNTALKPTPKKLISGVEASASICRRSR